MLRKDIPILMTVAQRPGGLRSNLASLVPLFYADGETADQADFPNTGLVFWPISEPERAAELEPGTLVISSIEPALGVDATAPETHLLKVQGRTLHRPYETEAIEIVEAYPIPISHPREFLQRKDLVVTNHRPAESVLVLTENRAFGPFHATAALQDGDTNSYLLTLTAPGDLVHEVERSVFDSFFSAQGSWVEADVSLERTFPNRSRRVITCRYDLLLRDAIESFGQIEKRSVVLKTPAQILAPIVRRYLDQKVYAQFDQVFAATVNALASTKELSLPGVGEIIDNVRSALETDSRSIRQLTEALVESGLLKPSLEDEVRRKVQVHIEQNAAQIGTEINHRVEEVQSQLTSLKMAMSEQEQAFLKQKQAQATELKQERDRAEASINQEKHDLLALKEEIDLQRNEVARHLDVVSEQYKTSREGAVDNFMALLPYFSRLGLLPEAASVNGHDARTLPSEPEYSLPIYVSKQDGSNGFIGLNETEFFARFTSHCSDCGFRYRDIDLASYHQNYKCGDFIILGGVSGTGKSSLPRLYAESLTGASDEPRLLRIPVNPAWLEVHDLFGRINHIDKVYTPAESGIYEMLIWAQREAENKGSESGPYTIILDEMNLAEIENYFGPLLNVLGSATDGPDRVIHVFSASSVHDNHRFRPWSAVALSPSIRFVGTVNFDETTKPLSFRVLDRAPLQQLDIAPGTVLGGTVFKRSTGNQVTMKHLAMWAMSEKPSAEHRKVLDEVSVPLKRIGCPRNT